MSRSCVFPGCHNVQGNDSVTLFKFPSDYEVRKRWINFIKRSYCGELNITTKTRLCSAHFTPDSFKNYHQVMSGFLKSPLMLVSDAEPTLSVPGVYPPAPPTTAAVISATGITRLPQTLSFQPTATVGAHISATGMTFSPENSPPTTREAACQCGDIKKVTREIGCQTDCFFGKRTVATQLSKRTLVNRNSKGSQATVLTKSVAVGDTTFQFYPLQSSTALKRKAVAENPPTKRPHLEFGSIQDSEPSVSIVDPDDSSYLPMSESVDTIGEQAPTKPVQDMVKYLVYEDCLLQLFKICPTCSSVCKMETFLKGTFLSVTQKCLHQSCLYSRKWESQPLLGSSPAGNLHLSAAVYYTGSSFIQTNKVLNAMHVRTFSRMTHHNHVHNYILPSVLHKWLLHQTDQLEELKQRQTVSLAGDMHADSPGHCAKYGSYSLMDLKKNTVVDIQLVQSNEVGSSVRMEKEGLIRSLDFLEKSGVKVASFVTDRHTQVQKFIQEQNPEVEHFYDVWHLCKALTKKVDAISKEKDCHKVKRWQKSIKNHLYLSACGSPSGEVTVTKWTSLLNHIQNVHVHNNPLFPECLHDPSSDKKKWLKPATKPTYRLEKVLMNKRILSDVKKLSPLYQTSALEGFQCDPALRTQKCGLLIPGNALQIGTSEDEFDTSTCLPHQIG